MKRTNQAKLRKAMDLLWESIDLIKEVKKEEDIDILQKYMVAIENIADGLRTWWM